MKTITRNQLREILAGIKHAMPIAFSAFTDPKAKKTGNPFVDIRKLSRVNAFTGADYEKSVQRQEVREGHEANFEAKSRQWGERISPALVKKENSFYLVAQIRSTRSPIYTAVKNGLRQVIKSEEIKPFLPEHKKSSQPIEKEVIYRNYKLENIRSITVGGESYKVIE